MERRSMKKVGNQKDHFKMFVHEMNDLIHSDDFMVRTEGKNQEDLLNDLFAVELGFRDVLVKSLIGRNKYKEVVEFFCAKGKNVHSLRTFFRERQGDLSARFKSAFGKSRMFWALNDLRINYNFAKWVIERFPPDHADFSELSTLYAEIIRIRKMICEQNLPLAINRAKIFWSRNTSYHLDYMDLIQASAEGLLVAIDKFVPPYRTVFRSVAIGRMTLNMITDNSSTMLKISPHDRRVLYRANNAVAKQKLVADSDIVDYVQQSFKGVTQENIQSIRNAAYNLFSIEANVKGVSGLPPESSHNIDMLGIPDMIREALESLDILERKVIVLKNGSFD
jgi:DNA-directed RNA polymerase specialized sigma subunit